MNYRVSRIFHSYTINFVVQKMKNAQHTYTMIPKQKLNLFSSLNANYNSIKRTILKMQLNIGIFKITTTNSLGHKIIHLPVYVCLIFYSSIKYLPHNIFSLCISLTPTWVFNFNGNSYRHTNKGLTYHVFPWFQKYSKPIYSTITLEYFLIMLPFYPSPLFNPKIPFLQTLIVSLPLLINI